MNIQKFRGFTLIELLVVIAIIGILSAVVLASLSTARSKGGDAAIQSNLATVQVQAEVYYSKYNSYGNTNTTGGPATCPTTSNMWADTNIKNAVDGAKNLSSGSVIVCNSTNALYAIQTKLVSPLSTTKPYWCVDSKGKTGATATALDTNTSCQ